jgi:hypothetical protein
MFGLTIGDIEALILTTISNIFYKLIVFENKWWWVIGLFGGVSFIIGWALKRNLIGYVFDALFVLTILIQPVMYFMIEAMSQQLWGEAFKIDVMHLWVYLAGYIISSVSGFLIIRYLVGSLDGFKDVLVKRSSLERVRRTDIRNMGVDIPVYKKQYNPERFIRSKKKIFIGLDKSNRPINLNKEKWRSSHIDFVGTTGSGKGVAAGLVMTQAVYQGEAIIALDPKNDEYLPHVLGQAAQKENVPFYYIDLQGMDAQWNPFLNKSFQEIEELFAAGFGLSEKGTDADFYRLNDRKAARIFARHIEGKNEALPKAFAEYLSLNGDALKDAPKFIEDLEEIASLSVTHIVDGLNISKAIEEGAVIYVRGSMRNPRILKLQKMFVLSVMQACENRDRETARHVCLFLDEFKYLISKPALEALDAIRDKRAHVMLAHQSLGDLRDCPKDIDPDSVVASINENCAIKLTYKVNDPNTADWLARMSGQILVDDEIRSIKTTKTLAEVKNPDRMLRQTERCLIDTNMLQSLPSRCAILYGNGLADFIFTSPIKVTKKIEYTTPTIFDDSDTDEVSVNDDIGVNTGGMNSIAEGLLDVD